MSRVTATGFEAALIESWMGWDQLDGVSFLFYDPVLKPTVQALVPFEPDSVAINLDSMTAEFYEDEWSEAPFKLPLKLVVNNA